MTTKKAQERYQILSKEENKKRSGHERCKSLPEDEKQKLVEYNYKMRKNTLLQLLLIRNYYFKK